jgi:uncharacterized membrane-anchored protein YitT (DUF2179 family)
MLIFVLNNNPLFYLARKGLKKMNILLSLLLAIVLFGILRAIILHSEKRESDLDISARIAKRLDRYAGYWRFSRR